MRSACAPHSSSGDPSLSSLLCAGWLGLGLFHTLFSLEHNAIAARLAEAFPQWDDERLFQVGERGGRKLAEETAPTSWDSGEWGVRLRATRGLPHVRCHCACVVQTARLVNAAVMAKIHTIEWTPGILANKQLHDAMNANWWGLRRGGTCDEHAYQQPLAAAGTASSPSSRPRSSRTRPPRRARPRSRTPCSAAFSAASRAPSRATASRRSSRPSTASTRCCPTSSSSWRPGAPT